MLELPTHTNRSGRPALTKQKGPVFSELPADLRPNVAARDKTFANVTGGAATASTTNAMNSLDDKHFLAISDRLSFRIVEDEDEPRSLSVMDSGELEVPYIGRFLAVGKTCKALARALKAELEKEYYVQATVMLAVDQMAKSRGNVYFAGPGARTGTLEIPSDEVLTLSKAILRMGGFTGYADKKNVKVTRKTDDGGADQVFIVNVEAILEKGKSESDLALLPGDIIYVDERLVRF